MIGVQVHPTALHPTALYPGVVVDFTALHLRYIQRLTRGGENARTFECPQNAGKHTLKNANDAIP